MKVGSGAWATSHFDPDLEICILGVSTDQEELLFPYQRPCQNWREWMSPVLAENPEPPTGLYAPNGVSGQAKPFTRSVSGAARCRRQPRVARRTLPLGWLRRLDRKSTRLNSSHLG